MIAKRLPEIENESDLKAALESLANSIYPERQLGRNVSADLFDKTFDILSQIRFKE